jgi:hypothetical protein
MGNLAQLSLNRVKGEIPSFSGSSLREKLLDARAQVHAILLQYVPDLKFDVNESRDVMSQVNAWVERNRDELEDVMKSSAQTLPSFLMLNMGDAARVQQWLIANYTVAAAGLGPWDAGKIDQLVLDPGSDVSAAWAEDDARVRLNVFGMLVKMERSGELRYVFKGPQAATTGFGALPVWAGWAIVVAVVSLAAVVTYFYLESRKIELNNALMRDICEKAQAEGDTATVNKCIEATRDLQKATQPWQGIVEQLGIVAIALGGGFLLVRYGVPWVAGQFAETKARRLT